MGSRRRREAPLQAEPPSKRGRPLGPALTDGADFDERDAAEHLTRLPPSRARRSRMDFPREITLPMKNKQ